jgi:hypothetical protein
MFVVGVKGQMQGSPASVLFLCSSFSNENNNSDEVNEWDE